MITFLVEDYNTFSNKTYIDLIDSISLNQLTCPGKHGNPCGHKGCMIKHGSYARTFSHDGLSETIFIVRVICKECGTTHALIANAADGTPRIINKICTNCLIISAAKQSHAINPEIVDLARSESELE